MAATSFAFASSSNASRARAAFLLLTLSSPLLNEGERSLLDFLLLDLGGGDLDREREGEEELATVDSERLVHLFRFRAAPGSGEGDLDGSLSLPERLSGERFRDGILSDDASLRETTQELVFGGWQQ